MIRSNDLSFGEPFQVYRLGSFPGDFFFHKPGFRNAQEHYKLDAVPWSGINGGFGDGMVLLIWWWFQICSNIFYVSSRKLGKIPNLTNILKPPTSADLPQSCFLLEVFKF